MKKVKNKKNFLILEMNVLDILKTDGSGICNLCSNNDNKMYYIAILNQVVCPQCYNDFITYVDRYECDIPLEEERFKIMCEKFNINPN